jgi:adenine/guanine phosphoribosyltransferase-like PRPP-binding protein
MRAAIESPELQLSVLEFLCAHEPDLLAAAEALGVAPGTIAAARERFAR